MCRQRTEPAFGVSKLAFKCPKRGFTPGKNAGLKLHQRFIFPHGLRNLMLLTAFDYFDSCGEHSPFPNWGANLLVFRPAASLQVIASLKDTRDRIETVKNTQKITEAMKLVAAAKVRRAQDAVINGRPFAENLVKVTKKFGLPF